MTIKEKKEHVEQLLNQGMKPHDIHKEYGYCEQSIYNWYPQKCSENNKAAKREKDPIREMVIELRKQGKTCTEIGEVIGKTRYTVMNLCKGSDYEYNQGHTGETFCEEYVDLEMFEYIGGYINTEGTVNLKCRKCGCVNEYRCAILRRNKRLSRETRCKSCLQSEKEMLTAAKRAEKQRKESETKRERAERKKKREEELVKQRNERRKVIHCCECGEAFITYETRRRFCSKKCSDKFHNREQTRKKQIRIPKERIIDNDISLRTLYERDKGFCHICGMHCDMTLDVNDNYYPSVDHVIPLSKGGEHSWGNVKLAHRRCNSSKGARMPRGSVQPMESCSDGPVEAFLSAGGNSMRRVPQFGRKE